MLESTPEEERTTPLRRLTRLLDLLNFYAFEYLNCLDILESTFGTHAVLFDEEFSTRVVRDHSLQSLAESARKLGLTGVAGQASRLAAFVDRRNSAQYPQSQKAGRP